MRNENKFAELQACDSDVFSELGQIVLVRVADLFDDSVKAQPLEQSRYLPAGFVGQVSAKCLVLQTADVELSARH